MTAYLHLCFQVTSTVTATFVIAVVKLGDPSYTLNYMVGATDDGSRLKSFVLILKVLVGDNETSEPV
jgi:hypothetical protein